MAMQSKQFERREARVRRTLRARVRARPRLSVFRSSKHIYAQVIDDAAGRTVAAASSLEKDVKGGQDRRRWRRPLPSASCSRSGRSRPASSRSLDRGGYIYHGRVKALADAAREGGLDF